MADNVVLPGTGRPIATDQATYSGDIADVQLVRLVETTGVEGSKSVISRYSLVSTLNSSTTNIAASGTFIGTAEDVSDYSHISVTIFSSHASATDGLQIQQSIDGTNWDFGDVFTIPAATGKAFSAPVQARYFRISYTNGATLTTSFRLAVLYSRQGKKGSSIRPQDGRANDNDVEESATYNQLFNGTSWDRQRGISLATTTGDTGAKTATGQGVAQTNVGNKGVAIVIALGAVTGTTPTCVFKVQNSVDGGTTWVDIPGAATASLTATGNFGISIYPGQVVTAGTTTTNTTATANGVLARTWRVVWTIGGTTPSFTITSITYNYLAN